MGVAVTRLRIALAAAVIGAAVLCSAPFAGAENTTASAGPNQTGPYGTPPWQESPGGYAGDNGTPTPALWTGHVDAIRSAVVADPDAPLLFVGDSITRRFPAYGPQVWDADFAGRSVDAGIGGDTTQNVLDRVDQLGELAGADPGTVVLLIGTNDFHHGWTPAQVTHGIVRVARTLAAKVPGANVVVVSLLPKYTTADPEWGDVVQVNAELAEQIPAVGGRVSWLNVWPDFVTATAGGGEEQTPGLFNSVQVHPTEAGYKVLASQLEADPLIGS